MTTPTLTTSALIIVDLQNDYFTGGKFQLAGTEAAAANAARLLDAARKAGDLVVHVRHISNEPDAGFFVKDTPGAEINALLQKQGFKNPYHFTTDPFEAVKDADIVYTDVWSSMGQEEQAKKRLAQMTPYAVTAKLFAAAKPDALFMHCLPAHPGEEVAQEVLDNPRAIIFDQAENRLHVQKAILSLLARK